MGDTAVTRSTLVEQFIGYYQEVIRLRRAINDNSVLLYLAETGGYRLPDAEASQAENGNYLAQMVARRLVGVLTAQARAVELVGTPQEQAAYREAQYVMAALSDEIFLLEEKDWPGQRTWGVVLIEQTLFGSRTSGRDFFTRLDRLLAERGRDPLLEEQAIVFVLALQLGFKGVHRRNGGQEKLTEYRRKLASFLGSERAMPVDRTAFPQALRYRSTDVYQPRGLWRIRWGHVMGAAVIVYLVATTVFWGQQKSRLEAFGDFLYQTESGAS